MTLTTSAHPPLKSRRWSGLAFGLIVGVVVICHGCHVGDRDDELSASGRRKPADVSSGHGTDAASAGLRRPLANR